MLCGDFGGLTTKGEPCKRAAGWGVPDTDTGRCKTHLEQEPAAPTPGEPQTFTALAGHLYRVEMQGTTDAAMSVTLTQYEIPPAPAPAPVAAVARVGWAMIEAGARKVLASVDMAGTWGRK